MSPLLLRMALTFVAVASVLCACRADNVRFYEVTRTRSEECTIRPSGEFCKEPEEFDPPVTEVWAVEVRAEGSLLYIDDDVWVLDPLGDGADANTTPRTGMRRTVVTRAPGPCTSTVERTVSLLADSASLTGTYDESSRLEGAVSCGETPVGTRVSDDVAGPIGAP